MPWRSLSWGYKGLGRTADCALLFQKHWTATPHEVVESSYLHLIVVQIVQTLCFVFLFDVVHEYWLNPRVTGQTVNVVMVVR